MIVLVGKTEEVQVLSSWFSKQIIKYIIYFKYTLNMGGSGRVWGVCNFMTQTQPDPL